MILQYVTPFLYALCLTGISLVLGVFWYRFSCILFREKSKPTPLFWIFFTGLLLGVSAIAIVMTGAVTILLFVPLLLLLLQQHIPHSREESLQRDILLLLFAMVVQYGLFLWMFSSRDKSELTIVHGDFNIYFRAAWRLWEYGTEAYNFTIYASENTLPGMYHYGDLWLYALCGRVNDFQPTHTFLTAFTLLSTLFTLGLVQYLRSVFRNVQDWSVLIFVFGGAFSAFAFCMPSFLTRFIEPYTLSVFNWGKVLLVSVCMVAALNLAQRHAFKGLLLLVLITGLSYINALPAFYGAFLLLLLITVMRKEETRLAALGKALVLPVLMLIPVVLQYKVLPQLLELTDKWPVPHVVSPFANLTLKEYLKTVINIFFGGWFQLFTLAPYWLLLVIGVLLSGSFKVLSLREGFRKLDNSLVFLLGLFVAGLASWAVTYPLQVDTVQFFHNTLSPIYCVTISLIIAYLLWVVKRKLPILLVLVVALSSVILSVSRPFFSGSFPEKDWRRLSAFIEKGAVKNGMFLCSNTAGALSTAFLRKSDQYVPLNILVYKFPQYVNVSLVSPFLKLNTSDIYYHEAYTDLRTSSLGRFFAKRNTTDTIAVIEDFVRSQPFSYYSVYRDTTMPLYLRPYASDSCILEESNMIVYRLKSSRKGNE